MKRKYNEYQGNGVKRSKLNNDLSLVGSLFLNLPKELQIYIFFQMDLNSLRNASRVCINWHALAEDRQVLLYKLKELGFDFNKDFHEKRNKKKMPLTFSKIYQKYFQTAKEMNAFISKNEKRWQGADYEIALAILPYLNSFLAKVSSEPLLLRFLFAYFPEFRTLEINGYTYLHWLTAVGKPALVISMLIDSKRKIDVNDQGNNDKNTPLHFLFRQMLLDNRGSDNLIAIINAYLKYGADLNRKNIDGYTILKEAKYRKEDEDSLEADTLIQPAIELLQSKMQ